MAVPSLIQKAGLTLFHNPHLQPEGVSIDYSDLGKFASVIQRSFRRFSRRGIISRAATRINALFRALSVRCYVVGLRPWVLFSHTTVKDERLAVQHLNAAPIFATSRLRQGRRYLAQHRDPVGYLW